MNNNCEYAPCAFLEETKTRLESLEKKVEPMITDLAVVKVYLKIILGVCTFIATAVGGWILGQILGLI